MRVRYVPSGKSMGKIFPFVSTRTETQAQERVRHQRATRLPPLVLIYEVLDPGRHVAPQQIRTKELTPLQFGICSPLALWVEVACNPLKTPSHAQYSLTSTWINFSSRSSASLIPASEGSLSAWEVKTPRPAGQLRAPPTRRGLTGSMRGWPCGVPVRSALKRGSSPATSTNTSGLHAESLPF